MNFTPAPKPAPREKKPPKPPRAKNAKRSASEFTRCYGSEERVEWVRSLPCIVPGCRQLSENAHIIGDGAGRKADADKIVPLCVMHHRSGQYALHHLGREEFEGTHMVDLGALALDTERCWRRFAGHSSTH